MLPGGGVSAQPSSPAYAPLLKPVHSIGELQGSLMAKISLRRVMSFYFVLFLVTVLLVEGLSLLAFLLVEKEDGEGNLYSERLSRSVEMKSGDSAATAPALEVIHPYLGYVYNPQANNEALYKAHENLSISEFGFVDEAEPIQAQSNDKVIIGIFGGSVAWWLSVQGIDSLKNEIRRIPGFTDKELVIVRTALGGFKQPQPLMALSYLLILGAHFDLVIEIDGVNEVALPPAENIPKNVFPVFPRNWYLRAQAGGEGRFRQHQRAVDCRPLPGTHPGVLFRERWRAESVHLQRRLDGPQLLQPCRNLPAH